MLVYSERCIKVEYWESYYFQSCAIFRILVYFGLEAYSEHYLLDIFYNESYNNIIFLFSL